ncbi:MAG: ABC transporter permease [Candidatus Hatepunaea meridiana]|nr:ABC transporter permease [Candidatus Hatepunaea meridiana]
MIAFRLAWRNLKRNKRRTILTSSALAVGLTVLIISMGFLDGVDKQSIDNLVNYDTAHLKGFAKGRLDQDLPDLDYTIPHSDSLVNRVCKVNGVTAAAARFEITGMLYFGSEEMFTRIIGIDPEADEKVFQTLSAVTSGKTFSNNEQTALIGDRLALDLGIKVGDYITLLVRSAPGALNPRILPVVGLISTGHPVIDNLTVYIPLSLAREMTLLSGNATEIAVKTDKLSNIKKLNVELEKTLPGFDWRSWAFLAEDFVNLSRMKRMGSTIMIGIITLVAAVGLSNTMIMSVHERTREIGALRALGFSSRLISGIFLCEGMLIGIIAGTAAVIIGAAVVSYLSVHGFSLEAYEDMDIGYPIQDAMYATLNIVSLIKSFLFGLILSVLASWGAARRAARGEIVRALREGML